MSLPGTGNRLSLALVLALLVTACDTRDQPFEPDLTPDPSLSVLDGANGGLEGFYFLAPLVKTPSTMGIFDPELYPRIEVCPEVGGPEDCAVFTRSSGPESKFIEVSLDDEHYKVNWTIPVVESDVRYAITVYLGDYLLGSADVQIFANRNEAKDAEGDVIALVDGRTLPIRIRLEEELVEEVQEASCPVVEGVIIDCDVVAGTPATGATAMVEDGEDGDAGFVYIPPGLASAPFVLTLEHLETGEEVVPDLDNHYPYFLRISAVDENGDEVSFAEPGATVHICEADTPADELHDYLRIYSVEDGGPTTLYNTEISDLCNDPMAVAGLPHGPSSALQVARANPTPLQRIQRGLSLVAGLFKPTPLRAVHGGLNTRGGRVLDFSDWGVTLSGLGIDGVLSPGEWDGADVYGPFDVDLGGGNTTEATVYVMEDGTDLFVAIDYAADLSGFYVHTASVRLDENPVDGVWNEGGDEDGDDGFTIQHKKVGNPNPVAEFRDSHYNVGAGQGQGDEFHGGTVDGVTGITSGPGFTVIEASHPLNSGDPRDAVLSNGDPFGLLVFTTLKPTETDPYVSSDLIEAWELRGVGFVKQPSFVGTCSPPATVCVLFDDGYRWQVEDAIADWRTENRSGVDVQIAEGLVSEYHHILGTELAMEVPIIN